MMRNLLEFVAVFCGGDYGSFECAEFIIDFLQFLFHIAFGNYASARLKPECIVAAYECANCYSLIHVAVKAYESYAAAIRATVMRFVFTYNLHCANFGGSAQCSGGESVHESLYGVCVVAQCARYTAHEMYDVAVVLRLAKEVYLYVAAVAAQVVSCQVHKHHMFCVFLRVVEQSLCKRIVSGFVAASPRCAGYGVYICCLSFHSVMGLGRRSEDSECSEIKVEQIRRGINASQCAIKIEIVAFVMLFEAAGNDNLENVSAQTVLYSFANVGAMLVIGQRTCGLSHGTERIYPHLVAVYRFRNFGGFVFAVAFQSYYFHFVAKAFEHYYIPI